MQVTTEEPNIYSTGSSAAPPTAASVLATDVEARAYLGQNFVIQALQQGLAACAAAFFVHWWALAWWLAVVALLYMSGRRNLGSKAPDGIWGTLAIGSSTILFASIWCAAWLIAPQSAGFLAGVLLVKSAGYGGSGYVRLHLLAFVGPAFAVPLIMVLTTLRDPVQIAIVLTMTAYGAVMVYIGRTTRGVVYAEIVRTQAEAEAARNESLAKSQFLATMSHELRTPLNAVLGYSEILEEDLAAEGSPRSAADAARIGYSARRLLTLIDDILTFSSLDTGKITAHIEQTDLPAILNGVISENTASAQDRNTDISVSIAPETQGLNTDPQRLRQCVATLVSNAVKFTQNGKVEIVTSSEKTDSVAMLRIDVRDTGCGVSPSDQARLFQPFSQIDGSLTRKNDGAGLGLAIASRLAQLLGGDMSYANAEGGGSIFTLRVRAYA